LESKYGIFDEKSKKSIFLGGKRFQGKIKPPPKPSFKINLAPPKPSHIMGRTFKTLAKQAFCSLSPDGERAGDRG